MSPLRAIALNLLLPTLLAAPVGAVRAGTSPAPAACENATAQEYIFVQQGGATNCRSTIPSGSTYATIEVYAVGVPFKKMTFTLPDPSFGTVAFETWYVPVTGNRTTGLTVTLPDCNYVGGSVIYLGALFVDVPAGGIGTCRLWQVNDGCTIEDCEGITRAATPWPVYFDDGQSCPLTFLCAQACQAVPAYNLRPHVGATNVPTDVVLRWDTGWENDWSSGQCFIHISTDPSCNGGQTIYVGSFLRTEFAPDFLQPGTTYYWQVELQEPDSACSPGDRAITPVHSFTTAGVVATRTSTWGYVKSMYRY